MTVYQHQTTISMVGLRIQSIVLSTFVFPMGGVRLPVAWILTILTACTAWLYFA